MPTIKDSSSIEEVLQYIVACYGVAIYQEKQRLSNLIADLYTGEERLKRLYRRMVTEDAVSQQLYAISLKPIQERKGFYNRLVYQFKEANFYEEAFARQVLDVFLNGMNLSLVEPISTKATEEDGEWVDECGVKYSADRKKLIDAQGRLSGDYRVLDGTIVICDRAFWFCENLQEITQPSSVMSIGNYAFWCCSNLQEINVAKSSKFYRDIDGVLYTKDLKTIICYPAGKMNRNFVIPSGVTSIGDKAFGACENLREITLPSSITSIGDDAFLYCENLQEINVTESNEFYRTIDGVLYTKDLKTIICYPAGKMNRNFVIPSDVMNIGNSSFLLCKNLREITLPSGVTSIGRWAFGLCKNLREITLPSGVTSIEDFAFSDCSNLHEINVAESNKVYRAIDGVLYTKDLKAIICYPQGKKDEKNVILSGVTNIGEHAFSHCMNLREITLPSSVTNIKKAAFFECKNLREITLSSNITSIGDYIFYDCHNLQQINIPRGTLEKFKKLLPKWTNELHEI